MWDISSWPLGILWCFLKRHRHVSFFTQLWLFVSFQPSEITLISFPTWGQAPFSEVRHEILCRQTVWVRGREGEGDPGCNAQSLNSDWPKEKWLQSLWVSVPSREIPHSSWASSHHTSARETRTTCVCPCIRLVTYLYQYWVCMCMLACVPLCIAVSSTTR